MTTGTALTTTYGELTFTKYDKTDANPPSNPRWSVDVQLKFLPSTTVPCDDVTYIQNVQSLNPDGTSRHRFVNSEQDARKTPLAWSIDRIAGAPSPFYITDRDPATGRVVDNPGWGVSGGGGKTPSPSTLIDQPSSSAAKVSRFETCVICRSGGNRGQVYGCATWGYEADASGHVTLMPRSFRQMPSDQFEEARVSWNAWNRSLPAADKREEAPALTSP